MAVTNPIYPTGHMDHVRPSVPRKNLHLQDDGGNIVSKTSMGHDSMVLKCEVEVINDRADEEAFQLHHDTASSSLPKKGDLKKYTFVADERECTADRRAIWKEQYLHRVSSIEENEKKESHHNVMTRMAYDILLTEVEEAKSSEKKSPLQFRRLKRFNVIDVSGVKKLVTRSEPIRYYLTAEETFDVIEACHMALGHGGRDRLKNETSRLYANITTEMIHIFLSMCETCQHKKNKKKSGVPIHMEHGIFSQCDSRCKIDLIDMRSQADHEFKFIMVFEDHATKFVVLRALQSMNSDEVAHHLVDIFSSFGAPCILHSDNGREFVLSVIGQLALFWPGLLLVAGKPRSMQNLESEERANKKIEKMLDAWMRDHNTTRWSNGLRFIQFSKNKAFHSDIKQSPYRAMFGVEPVLGIMASELPFEILSNLQDEDDLLRAIDHLNGKVVETADDMLDTAGPSGEVQDLSIKREYPEDLTKDAKRMKPAAHEEKEAANEPIEEVDRSPRNLQDIIEVVLDKNQGSAHKFGMQDVLFEKLFYRSDVSKEKSLMQKKMLETNSTSESTTVKASLGANQEYIRCLCKKACNSNRCFCKKKGSLCSTKCHESLFCTNK